MPKAKPVRQGVCAQNPSVGVVDIERISQALSAVVKIGFEACELVALELQLSRFWHVRPRCKYLP
ncbi:hypothetical protein PPL19_04080 [Pseudomonas psychrotolerans L19]|nr:hypothetical protein PPL19_04080 [Pseudomonas psychrotolerans L19]